MTKNIFVLPLYGFVLNKLTCVPYLAYKLLAQSTIADIRTIVNSSSVVHKSYNKSDTASLLNLNAVK